MKKLIKFDLEKAKSGEYGIVTRKGLGVEILSWNDTENKERPIAAKTDFENRVVLYYNNGRFDKKRNSEKDLFLMEKSDYDRYWGLPAYAMAVYLEWLNSLHVDYRNWIEQGLALVAPVGMYDFSD